MLMSSLIDNICQLTSVQVKPLFHISFRTIHIWRSKSYSSTNTTKSSYFRRSPLLIILLTPLIAFSCPFHSCVIIFQEKKLIFKTEGNSLEITRYKSKSIPPGKSYCFSLICSMWFIVKLIIHSLQKKNKKKKQWESINKSS